VAVRSTPVNRARNLRFRYKNRTCPKQPALSLRIIDLAHLVSSIIIPSDISYSVVTLCKFYFLGTILLTCLSSTCILSKYTTARVNVIVKFMIIILLHYIQCTCITYVQCMYALFSNNATYISYLISCKNIRNYKKRHRNHNTHGKIIRIWFAINKYINKYNHSLIKTLYHKLTR